MTEPTLGSARERLRRLYSNTGIYAAGDAAVKLLNVLLAPILTRLLLPAELGIWGLATMVFTGFMQLCNPALHGAVTRFYFEHEHEPEAQKRFQGTVASFLLVWSFLLCIVATITGDTLFAALFDDFPFWPYGALVVWMVLLATVGVVPKAIWLAAEKSKSLVGINLLGSAVEVLGQLGLVAFTSLRVLGLFFGRAASLLVIAIPLLSYSLRNVRLRWSWADLRSALRFSLPLVPHLLAHWVLSAADRYLIERHYRNLDAAEVLASEPTIASSGSPGLTATGIYFTAYVFIDLVNLVAVAMNRAWVPMFTRAHGRPEQQAFVASSITNFMLAVGAMSAAMVVASPTIVRAFYPADYQLAAELAPILALGGLFQGFYYVYVAVLFYYKDNRLIPVITVVSGIVNVALNLLWLPKYGLVGVAWATTISYSLLFVGMRWAARRFTMPGFERASLLRIAIVLVSVTVAGLLLDGRLPLGWEALAKLGVLGVGAGALWLLRQQLRSNTSAS
jgi:O-antigen/teichoic acid export membrane protein